MAGDHCVSNDLRNWSNYGHATAPIPYVETITYNGGQSVPRKGDQEDEGSDSVTQAIVFFDLR